MVHKYTRNVRFWVYANGTDVRLTLKPGQTLQWEQGGPTDEGWSSNWEQWTYDEYEGRVEREWCHSGRDCDGRHEQGGTDDCPFHELEYYPPGEWSDVPLPKWERVSSGQRDYTAEAAGY